MDIRKCARLSSMQDIKSGQLFLTKVLYKPDFSNKFFGDARFALAAKELYYLR